MLRLWQAILMITYVLHVQALHLDSRPDYDLTDWRYVEALAEEHPYAVALLNKHGDIHCSGAIISCNSVVTTGTCATRDPHYVAVGSAVIRHNALNSNSLFKVSTVILPSNYNFNLNLGQPNNTIIENNIGLVITVKSTLATIFDFVDVSNLYASELVNKIVGSIGYTAIHEIQASVLSKQWYHEAMCLNLKWYYCMCGFEFASSNVMSYYRLGEGGPVMLEDETIVGVTTFPSGRMLTPKSGLKYNVFTITAPYKGWLMSQKEPAHQTVHEIKDKMVTKLTSSSLRNKMYFKNLLTLMLASKLLI